MDRNRILNTKPIDLDQTLLFDLEPTTQHTSSTCGRTRREARLDDIKKLRNQLKGTK